ncbi:hypothetical protein CHS0354_002851 [Potamilus streckersoni]|uniref:RING-CH-type domain-containing protein n=1 Tax=Potamilus streckersoni TaxID=2493646 RepID=A0AAE0SN63_9BIVA|nr:hypothetical protein CHS0354_002851 [Potamilus streckersoni]
MPRLSDSNLRRQVIIKNVTRSYASDMNNNRNVTANSTTFSSPKPVPTPSPTITSIIQSSLASRSSIQDLTPIHHALEEEEEDKEDLIHHLIACSECPTCKAHHVRPLPLRSASPLCSTPAPHSIGCSMTSPLCTSVMENSFCSEEIICRICHEGDQDEELISPCLCAGSMGMLHISCLEQWLGSSNTTKCEICQYQFCLKRYPRPLKWYLHEPSLKKESKRFVRNLLLMIFFGILAVLITVICLVWSAIFIQERRILESTSLIMFVIIVDTLYGLGFFFGLQQNLHLMRRWQHDHQVIKIQHSVCKEDSVVNVLGQEEGDTDPSLLQKLAKKLRRQSNRNSQNEVTLRRYSQVDDIIFDGSQDSLESYKKAISKPIPSDENISVNVTSPCLIKPSVQDGEEEATRVTYYKWTKAGSTVSYKVNDTDSPLMETIL